MNELKHHGIIDMRWGVRNGPPYPLSRAVSTGNRLKKKIKDKVVASGGSREYKKQKKLLNKAERAKARAERARQKEEAKNQEQKRISKSVEQTKINKEEIAKQKAIEKNVANAARQKTLDHGSAEEVAKYLKTMSNEEMQKVVNRFNLESQILSKIPQEESKKDALMNTFSSYAKDAKIVSTTINNTREVFEAYNKFIYAIKTKSIGDQSNNNNKKDKDKKS